MKGDYAEPGGRLADVGIFYRDSTKRYEVRRAFLFFDTSVLPDGARITGAALKFYSSTGQEGNATLHLVSTQSKLPPSPADYGRITWTSGGTALPQADAWNTLAFSQSALPWVNTTAITRLGLVIEPDLNRTLSARRDLASLYMPGSEYSPVLVVYYVP